MTPEHEPSPGVGDENVERLIGRYAPVSPDPAFVARVEALALRGARERAAARRARWLRPALVAVAAGALVALGVAIGRATAPGIVRLGAGSEGGAGSPVEAAETRGEDRTGSPVEAGPSAGSEGGAGSPAGAAETRSEGSTGSPVEARSSAGSEGGAGSPVETGSGGEAATGTEALTGAGSPSPSDAPLPPLPADVQTPVLADSAPAPVAAPAPALAAMPRPSAPEPLTLAVGAVLETGPRERTRVRLPDGSTLYVDAGARLRVESPRRVAVDQGEVYLEVAPRPDDPFVVATPTREVVALGTAFVVRADGPDAGVAVTHGRVRVGDAAVDAGWRLSLVDGARVPLGRATHALAWARDLIASAEAPLVPRSRACLTARDEAGREAPLSLRAYAVDVHLEDGFARTAVDQTYFNHDHVQREGTFHFPLPADASIARLAMYVEGVLMEGGMVERDRARTVFETIRWQRRDPALLEWLDGSTFRMRVFPLEPRQEKRVVLGYTQRLPSAHGRVTYRFAAGHTLGQSGTWSFRARVKGGAHLGWSCRTHALDATVDGDDLVLTARHAEAALDRDLVLTLEPAAPPPEARALLAEHDGWRYLALRLTNAAPLPPAWAPAGEPARRRDWVLVVETSADRDPVVARVAYDLARALLEAAEAGDTFALIAASTTPRLLTDGREPCTPDRVQAALARLERRPLLGALDLGAAWTLAREATNGATAPVLVHLGSAIPVIGERREAALLGRLPAGHVLGLGVGKRWNRALLRAAAARTGGYFTQVTPDEPVRWRALEARSALDAPRVVDLRVEAPGLAFLTDRDALAHGEEALAVARLPRGDALPATLAVTGTLDGAPWRREVSLERVERGAGYLPRAWARLEVDRLVALGPERRTEVVALSKQSHVLSPYTSLLVLETDAMHKEFDVPKGRVEPWAPYALPARLEVRREIRPAPGERRPVDEVLATILRRGDYVVAYDARNGPRRGVLTERGLRFPGPFPSQGIVTNVRPGDPLPVVPPKRVNGISQQVPAQGTARHQVGYNYTDRQGADGMLDQGRLMALPPDYNGNVVQTLEEGPKQEIFSRATRRIEETDWKWRRDSWSEDADGNPTWRDDEDPSLPGFERFLWPEGRGRIVLGNDFGVADSEFGRIDLRFGGFLHPQVRSSGRTRSQDTRAPGVRYDRVLDTNGADTRWTASPSSRHPRALTADLLAFAPGMDTSQADVLAVLAAEASLPGPGRVDPAAAALVERARRAPWTTVTLLDDEGREAGQVHAEGGGRFVAERRLRVGLIERVVSDGTTLWHLYPELGLGARRAWSGFHHDEVLRPLVPWLLPPPEHLARGADVVLAAAGQVEVLPHDAGRARQVLVFEGTSLVERRWTDADGRLLARERYAADGTVEVERDGQRVTWRLPHRSRPAPLRRELSPPPELLLLHLPFRAPPSSWLDVAWTDAARRTDEELLRLVGAGLCDDASRWTAVEALARSPLARTPGGVTLLLQLGLGDTWYVEDPASNHLLAAAEALAAESAVVRFALEQARWAHQRTLPPATLVGAPPDSFLARLALYRHLHARWSSPTVSAVGVVTRNDTLPHLDRLAVDPYCAALAWDLAQTVTWNVKDDPAALRAFAAVVERVAERPALAEPAGLLAARLRAAAGDVDGCRERLMALHARAVAQGRLLPLDDGVLQRALGDGFAAWARQTGQALLARGARSAALDLAHACRADREHALGLALAALGAPRAADAGLITRAASLLVALGESDRALAIVGDWIAGPRAEASIARWAASTLARDRRLLALAWLERAAELELQAQGDVDLPALERATTDLLVHYDAVLDAARTLEQPPPADLLPRVLRTVDRWRAVDTRASVCLAAAKLLRDLGEHDLAREYLLSVVAPRPHEGAAWATLARALEDHGRLDEAEPAWARAFEVEETNAEYLWCRADLLRRLGRSGEARPPLERLAAGPWQPRFRLRQWQACEVLGLPAPDTPPRERN
ncbi:MAG: FecR domain-containing protein [Planctomycetes bacterium]|nr:FecR domain-containing protein [Planctomycetota bacterium]